MQDKIFQNANKVLKSQMKQNKKDGLDVSASKEGIDQMDLEKLYSGYFLPGLADGNTEVLLHKVFFDLLYHTGRRGKEGLRYLKRSSFEVKKNPAGRRYIEITFNEATKKNQGGDASAKNDSFHNNHAIINEQPGDDLCPVSSMVHYIENTHEEVDSLFQKPSKCRTTYDKQVIGKNPLGDMMKTISKAAGLSKEYTNHQIRKTTATALARSGFTLKEISNVTKHKNLESLKYYIGGPTLDEKETYSNALHEYAQKSTSKRSTSFVKRSKDPLDERKKIKKTAKKPTSTATRPPAPTQNATTPAANTEKDDENSQENQLEPAIPREEDAGQLEIRQNVVQNQLKQAASLFQSATFNNCTINLQIPK